MDVARGAGQARIEFRHEGQRAAFLHRDLLGAVLVDRVLVGHVDGRRVLEIDLVLSRPPLALRALDGDARGFHLIADLADDGSSRVPWRM